MEESIRLRGQVRLVKTWLDGTQEIETYKNLIVNTGKQLLAKRLAGASAEYVSKMIFGTGATPAADGDTALGSAAGQAYATTDTYPTISSVMFVAAMAPNEGNNITYKEMGLFTAANTLFARLLLGVDLEKTANFRLDIEWTISFIYATA